MANLSTFAELTGFGDTWDMTKGVALAISELSEQGVVLLIPVKDAKAALAKLDAQPEGKLHRARVAGKSVPILTKGNLLICAEDASVLEKFRSPAKRLADSWTDTQRRMQAESGLFVYVNLTSLRPLIEKALVQAEALVGQLENLPQGALGQDPKMTVKLLELYVKAVREIVAQTDVLYLSLSVDADRIRFQKGLVFSEGSYARKMFAGRKPPTPNLLSGLPQMPFYMAMGFDTAGMQPMVVDLFGKMLDEVLAAADVDAGKRQEILDKTVALYRQMNGFNGLVNIDKDGMATAGVYFVKDPKLAQEQVRDSMQASSAMMQLFVPVAVDVKSSQKQIGQIQVDEFLFELGAAQDDQNAPQIEMIKKIYGDQLRMQFGIVGKSLGYAMSSQKEPIRLLLTKSKPLTEAAPIRAICDDLPKAPTGIVLFDVFGFFRAITASVSKMGIPLPIPNVPDSLQAPPIGIAVTAESDGFIGQLVVRSDTVAQIAKFFQEVVAK